MPSTKLESFERTVQSADKWLSDVAEQLETDDRRAAYRALRAWLQILRDRLTVDSAAKFGAQLPELLRGVYYEGWDPSRVPIKFGAQDYVTRFAFQANMATAEVPRVAAAVSAALSLHMPGQMSETLAQLPHGLRELITSGTPATTAGTPGTAGELPQEGGDALADLRGRVDTLTEAIRTLASGFERGPFDEPDGEERRARAARLASEMLIAIRA